MMLESMLWLNTPTFVARFLEDTVLPAIGALQGSLQAGTLQNSYYVASRACTKPLDLPAVHADGAAPWSLGLSKGRAVAEEALAHDSFGHCKMTWQCVWTTVSHLPSLFWVLLEGIAWGCSRFVCLAELIEFMSASCMRPCPHALPRHVGKFLCG